jgi:hypothetical protein
MCAARPYLSGVCVINWRVFNSIFQEPACQLIGLFNTSIGNLPALQFVPHQFPVLFTDIA